MAKVTGHLGVSGSGKTLLMSNEAYAYWLKGARIYSNYDLNFNHPGMDIKTRIKEGCLNYTPIFTPDDLYKTTPGSVIVISELDSFGSDELMMGGVDSYDFKSKPATRMEKFVKKRLRKSHSTLLYDVQQLMMIPKRIREETLKIYEPFIYQWGRMGAEFVPYRLHYRERKIDNLDGIHKLTGRIFRLGHPIFSKTPHPKYGFIKHITPDMLKIYDTDADPFKDDDPTFRREESNNEDPAYRNELIIFKRLKKRLNFATVSAIPNSGQDSKKYGDLEIDFPIRYKIPRLIIEVKSPSKNKDGHVFSINARTKAGNITNWAGGMAFDEIYGTKHLGAFFDPNERKTYLFGIKENFEYLGKKVEPHISQLKGVVELNALLRSIKGSVKDEPINRSITDKNQEHVHVLDTEFDKFLTEDS